MTTQVQRASFAIEDMSEGGGNFFGAAGPARAKLVGGRFTKEAPDGYNTEGGNQIFGVADFLLPGDGPEEERRYNQSFSMGGKSGDEFTISENGDYLVPTTAESRLVKTSKFGIFAASLQNEGVPKPIMQAFAWSVIAGLDGDWKRIADPKREGLSNDNKKSKYPPSTLCLVKLHAMPGEAAKAAPATTASNTAAAPTTAPAVQTTGDLDADTFEFLKKVLSENNGTMQRGRITLAVSKAVGEHPQRQAYAKRASEESFLNTLADAGMVKYAAAEKGQPVTLA